MAKEVKDSMNGVKSMRGEPVVDLQDYNRTISHALNYYNDEYSLSDYKQSALEYATTLGIKVNAGIPEYMFRGIGAVCRLILRNCTLRVDDVQNTITKLKNIQLEYEKNKVKDDVPIKIVIPQTQQFDFLVIDFCNSIEDELIEAILDSTPQLAVESLIKTFASVEYTKTQIKEIIKFINKEIDYYNTILVDKKGSCEQTKEAYIHIPSTRINNALKQLKLLLDGISKTQEKVKVSKVISKKELSPILQTSKIPYQLEYNGIKSLLPSQVIGKSIVWLFDTDTRDLIILRSLAGKFKASGQSFLNVGETNSFKKKLRNPDKQLSEFCSALDKSKKIDDEYFDNITSKSQKAVGRMSENKIILCVY